MAGSNFHQLWDAANIKKVNTIGIAFLGDIMLGRYMLPIIERVKLKALLNLINDLIGGRYVVANLESPFSTCQFPVKSDLSPVLKAPVEVAVQLREAGISGVSLANNHIFDCGYEGLAETIQTLDLLGIHHVGAGSDLNSATRPIIINIDSRSIGIIAFSYTPPARKDNPGVAYLYDDTVDYTISRIRKDVDFLVVMAHAGIELIQYPLPRDQKVYRKMIDLGADIVIGSHPHCVQAMEVYKEKFIFYSLGDCIFDHYHEAVKKGYREVRTNLRKYSIITAPKSVHQSLIVTVDFLGPYMKVGYEPLIMRYEMQGSQPIVNSERKEWFIQFKNICDRLVYDQILKEKLMTIENRLLKSLLERGLL